MDYIIYIYYIITKLTLRLRRLGIQLALACLALGLPGIGHCSAGFGSSSLRISFGSWGLKLLTRYIGFFLVATYMILGVIRAAKSAITCFNSLPEAKHAR